MSRILMTRREEGSESAMAQPSTVVTSQGTQLQWPRTGVQEHPGLATLTQSICPLRHNSEGKSILAPCCDIAREGFGNKPSPGQAHPSLSRTSLMASDRHPSQSSARRIYSEDTGGAQPTQLQEYSRRPAAHRELWP